MYWLPNGLRGKTTGELKNQYCCGADTCELGLCGAACGTLIAVCGNGFVEAGEECDDGNSATGDGCDGMCRLELSSIPVPDNQFNIGDSIGEAQSADGTIGSVHHQTVWTTGYDAADIVDSVNERFEADDPAGYYENDAARDATFNRAMSGAGMVDFVAQAQNVVAGSAATPTGEADMVTVLLGSNDVCAPSLDDMTDPELFETQYRAGLDVPAQSPSTALGHVRVSGISAIYWLWNAKRTSFYCRVFVWPFVPCENLLSSPGDDCESAESRLDPDSVYPGDGPACSRRKAFHAAIRNIYNPILHDVLAEYRVSGALPNAEYLDIFDVPFDSIHVNNGDCFHPSTEGHALLAETQWCRSKWGGGDAMCSP